MKALRIASICHGADDYRKQGHRRVTLRLRRDGERYVWLGDDDEHDTGVDGATVAEAVKALCDAWGAAEWDLRARWLER